MCVLFIYLNLEASSPDEVKLIVVSIRDEFWHRPTAPADFWECDQNIIGGRDMFPGREGGSWLVVSKKGRVASLLNILEPSGSLKHDKKGRGFLAVDFVRGTQTVEEYLGALNKEKTEYNGFTVVALDLRAQKDAAKLAYLCNHAPTGPVTLDSGVHVFGNSCPPKRWAKVEGGEEVFQKICGKFCNSKISADQKSQLIDKLLEMVDDTKRYPIDESMRKQSDESDETLAARNSLKFYIPEWNYGSRTHSVLLVSGNGQATFVERTLEVDGDNKIPLRKKNDSEGDVASQPEPKWVSRKYDFEMEIAPDKNT